MPGAVLADEPTPPIAAPSGVEEGGPIQGFLTDMVTSDTSGKIEMSAFGVFSTPGVLGWSCLSWNALFAMGASKTEITAGDGYFYQLIVRSNVYTDFGHSYDDQATMGGSPGDKAYAMPEKVWRVGSDYAQVSGEHSVIRIPPGPMWSWIDTTNITHKF
ncbi:MAG: hypothetical protein DRI37_05475 [Chloroflexi bacterium]|nr:MAG: hypothetical protein DRI37_05475 [Chloroflexota bacterium]